MSTDLFGKEVSDDVKRLKCKGYAATPGSGPENETCRTCKHIVHKTMAKTYLKCIPDARALDRRSRQRHPREISSMCQMGETIC